MSKRSNNELVKRIHPRYLQATKVEKGQILDEFVANTGYHRKHAIRLLRKGVPECTRERWGHKRVYTGATVQVLAYISHLPSKSDYLL